MSTLTLRLTKGSALTYQEADDNFTNLNNDKLQNVVEDTTPQLGGNLDVNGNSIVSVSNANISITPNGTGKVILDGLSWPTADGTSNQVLKTDGSGNLSFATVSGGLTDVVNDTTPQLGGSLDVNGNSIVSTSNGNITLAPNGTGKVVISGDLQVDGTTTTINSTTLDVDDINITVAKGAVNAAAANGAGLTVEGPTTNATLTYASADDSWNLNKLTKITGNLSVSGDIIAPTGGGGDLTLAGDGTGNINLNSDTVRIGDNNTDATITTHGTGDLLLNTNGGSSSGVIRINDGANGNIAITPDGTGSIVLDGLNWPTADGSANQVLKTNGTGQLSFVTISSGITDVVNDTTPQLGGDLDVNGFDITDTGATALLITSNTDKNLGLRSQGTGDVILLPLGTGKVVIDTLNWPTADGTSNQYLKTDGAGNLSWSTISGSGITDVVQDTTPQLGGNLDVQSYSITSSVGSITLSPSGNNDVILDTEGLAIGDGTGVPSIYSNNATYEGIVLKTHSTYLGAITLNGGNNGDIKIEPHGTGDIILASAEIVIGDVNANVVLTTSGTGDLTLSTGNNLNTGSITIADGVNGNITLTPNGTGRVVIDGISHPIADGTNGQVLQTNGSGVLSFATVGVAVGSVTGLGTGVATALAVNINTDGAVLVRGGALGTPSGGVLTNATGLPVSTGISGLGTGVATFLATPSSANLISAVTDETGTGTLVFSASPTFTGTVNAAALTLTGAATLKDIRETVYAIGNSGATTLTPDAANGSVQTITATGNFTLSAFSNPVSGQTITFIITQDATGSRTLTSTMKFAGASKTLSTAASSIDILNVSYIGTTYYASLIKGYA